MLPQASTDGQSLETRYCKSYFERYYRERDWRSYCWILSLAIARSAPGPLLDVGAGVGHLVEAGRRWGLDCLGVEGSKNAIRIGKERCPGLPIIFGSIGSPLPFPDESFQTVIINQVIEHLDEITGSYCLKESQRVLKPNGMMFIASPSRFNSDESSQDPTHLKLYTPRELSTLIKSCGFERVESMDTVRPLLGRTRLGLWAIQKLFRVSHWDVLSNSATCIAFKRAN